MGQVPARILIPVIACAIFVAGFFLGNLSGFTSNSANIILQEPPSAAGIKNQKILQKYPDIYETTDDQGRILVDLSIPIPTPPSLTVLSNKIDHEPPSCTSLEKSLNIPAFTFVIFIFSAAQQVERRKALRETWGTLVEPKCGTRLIFVLGLQNETPGTQAEVKKFQDQVNSEAEKYKDILQFGHFIDNSRSPTVKALKTFEWSLRECPKAEYTMKGEDHVWLNLPDFTKWVKEQKGDMIYGHRVYGGSVVFRDPQSFFYVSRDDFADDAYPEYMTSMMYVIPQKVLKTLLDKAPSVQQIPLEDVYFTGIVANAAGVSRWNVDGFEYDYLIDKSKRDKCPKKLFHAVRYMPPSEMYKYWEDKCHKPTKPCFLNATTG